MASLDRSYWLAVAAMLYVGAAAVQSAAFGWGNGIGLVLGPLVLAWVWRRTARGSLSSHVEPAAQIATRIAAAGALVWVHSRMGTPGEPTLEVAAALAAGSVAISGAFGLARVASVPSLVLPSPAARSVDAAAFTGVLWGAASVISATRLLAPEGAPLIDPLALDYAITAASIGSLLVLIAAAWRVRVLRELELGVADRAEASVAITVTAVAVAVPVAAIDVAAPDRVLPLAMIVAALGCCWTVLAPDPASLSSAMRGTIAVMLLGVPTALLSALFIQSTTAYAGLLTLVTSALAILVGLIARNVARPLGPEQSRWLLAISEASERALDPEPNLAIAATLRALKRTSRDPTAIPQLWRLDPPSVISVDVAGYLHESPGEIPTRLCELGLAEPERTLRAEVLRSVEVRRTDVRPLLSWFDVQRAFSATIVLDEDGPTGFLLLPRGERSSRLTLEEARAVRQLADRVSALFSVSSALARSRLRETSAESRAEHFEREFQRARRIVEGGAQRHRESAQNLARPLITSAYSPAVRLAISELQQLAKLPGPVWLQAPVGVDVVAWAALAHLGSVAHGGPFVAIDAAAEVRESARRWSEPETSPLALARAGTLFIQDLHLLPLEIQTQLLQQLTAAPVPSEADEIAPARLIASSSLPLRECTRDGRLSKAWEPILEKVQFELPSLADRPEDLRALILDSLSRMSRGPVAQGIQRPALQALLDHPWPGNERELRDVVERASQLETQPLLSLETLRASGFSPLRDPAVLRTASVPAPDEPWSEPAPPNASSAAVASAPRRRPRAPRRPRRRG